jgi:hypothetical protein
VDSTSPDGLRTSSSGTDALGTALATKDVSSLGPAHTVGDHSGLHGPWVLVYSATDSAGNQAEPALRRVYIDASCPNKEFRCPATADCSFHEMCLPMLTEVTAVPQNAPYVPLVDTTPPVIEPRLGEGDSLLFNPKDGKLIAVTQFMQGHEYHDAGATAVDDSDGDLTALVSAYGLKAVDTSAPTAVNKPFVVQYEVSDRTGNVGKAARRVMVLCQSGESICEGGRAGVHSCSVDGVCVPSISEPAVIAAPPPSLVLQGPSTVTLELGTLYTKCAARRATATVCDEVCLDVFCNLYKS